MEKCQCYCIWILKKQLPEVFHKKGVLKNLKTSQNSYENTPCKIHRKKPVPKSLFLIKLQSLKQKLRHGCFPLNCEKLSRTPISNNTCRLLLLTLFLVIYERNYSISSKHSIRNKLPGISDQLLYDAFQRYPRKKWQSRKSLVLLKLYFYQERDIKNVPLEILANDIHFEKLIIISNFNITYILRNSCRYTADPPVSCSESFYS